MTNFNKFIFDLIDQFNSNFDTFISNVFSLRNISNKMHGDMLEIGLSEYINRFLPEYSSIHCGKELYRRNDNEEDIIVNHNDAIIPISLKCYGVGPLQLSTDKKCELFNMLNNNLTQKDTVDKNTIDKIVNSSEFKRVFSKNILTFIYDERKCLYNVMTFNSDSLFKTHRIIFVNKDEDFDTSLGIINKKGRKHPVYIFLDENNNYLFEVRYGGKTANALQRGLWTNTKKTSCMNVLFDNWRTYTNTMFLNNLKNILFQ